MPVDSRIDFSTAGEEPAIHITPSPEGGGGGNLGTIQASLVLQYLHKKVSLYRWNPDNSNMA